MRTRSKSQRLQQCRTPHITAGKDSVTAPTPTSLLDLPDPCLLAVLQCCAEQPATLFSAARAHSRLHQVAWLALSKVSVQDRTQQQVDGLLQYLQQHGQHVSSISLGGVSKLLLGGQPALGELPPSAQLHSLQLSKLRLQLQPGGGFAGVLGAAGTMPLTQLQFSNCTLLGLSEGLAAALTLLPVLQHLSVSQVYTVDWHIPCPSTVIQQLQQLMYLDLDGIFLQGSAGKLPSMKGLTRLVHLRLGSGAGLNCMEDDWLAGCSRLTHLVLWAKGSVPLYQGALAGQTQLQHLETRGFTTCNSSEGAAQLFSELQTLQQLTRLCWGSWLDVNPPAAAFSALTASSRLRHLDISGCMLPAGVWQHVFTADRQLPHLTSLEVERVMVPGGSHAAAPAGTLLLSCCPGLQSLNIMDLYCCAEQLSSLNGLSRLHTLLIGPPLSATGQGLETVGQLTSLRQLTMRAPLADADRPLLHLTALQHLTRLEFQQQLGWDWQDLTWQDDGGGGEPVWRQVLQHHLTHSDPSVPLQARQSDAASTAALA